MSKVISLIMAAGRGTRMGGDDHKCLTPVGPADTPFIMKQMEKLWDAIDIKAFVIVVGHLSRTIEQEVGAEFKGRPVHYVFNPEFADYGSGWSLLKGTEFIRKNLDSTLPLIVTEADCLIPTEQYRRLVGTTSSCLVGPRIDITKSVVVTESHLDGRLTGFTYDRNHINVLRSVQSNEYAVGESIQTWYIAEDGIENFTHICKELYKRADEEDGLAESWSNLVGFNNFLAYGNSMMTHQYDGTFINLNTPADVELCNAQPWL